MNLARLAESARKVPETVLRLRGAYHATFLTPSGDRVLKDLYHFCHGMQGTHVTGESHETAFREGQRSVLIRIFHKIKVHDERKMLKRLEEMRDE